MSSPKFKVGDIVNTKVANGMKPYGEVLGSSGDGTYVVEWQWETHPEVAQGVLEGDLELVEEGFSWEEKYNSLVATLREKVSKGVLALLGLKEEEKPRTYRVEFEVSAETYLSLEWLQVAIDKNNATDIIKVRSVEEVR